MDQGLVSGCRVVGLISRGADRLGVATPKEQESTITLNNVTRVRKSSVVFAEVVNKVNWVIFAVFFFAVFFALGILAAIAYFVIVHAYTYLTISNIEPDAQQAVAQKLSSSLEVKEAFNKQRNELCTHAQNLETKKKELLDESATHIEYLRSITELEQVLQSKETDSRTQETQQRAKRLVGINNQLTAIKRTMQQVISVGNIYTLQHPEFTKVSNSTKGFPFDIFFEEKELPQTVRSHGMVDEDNDQFNTEINAKLMDWAGVETIDPFTKSVAAQAQDVLVQLSRCVDKPFVINPEEKLRLCTMDHTVRVRFEADLSLVIERQVQINNGTRYHWVETIHFREGVTPVASRCVTKI